MDERSARRNHKTGCHFWPNEVFQLASPGCARIPLLARSTGSTTRPNTLMQLSRSSVCQHHLATHGRTIHNGTGSKIKPYFRKSRLKRTFTRQRLETVPGPQATFRGNDRAAISSRERAAGPTCCGVRPASGARAAEGDHPHDNLAVDHAPRHASQGTEYQRRNRIMQSTGHTDLIYIEGHDVRCHLGREVADVVSVEHLRSSKRRHLQSLPGRHRGGTEPHPLEQHGLPCLAQQMASVV